MVSVMPLICAYGGVEGCCRGWVQSWASTRNLCICVYLAAADGCQVGSSTEQNLGRDDLEVFSTIKDPFGLETKSGSKPSRPIVLNVEAGVGVN